MRGATAPSVTGAINISIFQPTRPLRGATTFIPDSLILIDISTHAPLAGRDPSESTQVLITADFNPRAPCGARPTTRNPATKDTEFQPTRPLRGATFLGLVFFVSFCISTHAPLAGRDSILDDAIIKVNDFNPRAPCGARLFKLKLIADDIDFNPRAPCGARQCKTPISSMRIRISTHAPLAGRDSKSVQITMHIFAITDKFQMLLHRMPPVRAFCSFLTQENHADLGANRPSGLCALVLRTIRSSVPRADTSACSRSVRFYSRTSCPSSKIEGCPFLGQ